MPLDEGLLEHSQMAHGPDSRGGDLVNPDRSCGVVLEKDGELRFVTGDELSALSGSDSLLMEGQFGEGFDERPMLALARESMSERILDLLVEWHGDEIQRRAEAMIAAGQTLTAEDLVSITHEVARSFGRNRR